MEVLLTIYLPHRWLRDIPFPHRPHLSRDTELILPQPTIIMLQQARLPTSIMLTLDRIWLLLSLRPSLIDLMSPEYPGPQLRESTRERRD